MYFPVSGIEVAPWVPFVAGFLVAFFCSMGGVSGANLLLPFQMSVLGFTTPAVSATNHFFNIVAIPSGVYRYIREGRMVWPLTWMVIAGTIPGVFVGVFARVHYLPDPTHFKFFAGLVLLYIGGMMVSSLIKKAPGDADKKNAEARFQELANEWRKSNEAAQKEGKKLPTAEVKQLTPKKMEYTFYGESFSVNPLIILALSGFVGIVGGIYGIGGGAIIAPVFVAIFKLPVYTIAGACLMGTFLTSLTAVIFYQIIAPFYPHLAVAPDWILGLMFGFGGALGMYLGARIQKFIPAKVIKWILASILIFTALRYVFEMFK